MKVLCVFAHPDDETFSSGGTITQLTQQGVIVKLITATKGGAGLCGNPPICTKEELPKVREKELKKAAKILGISQIYFLDYIDGTLHKISFLKIAKKILPIFLKEKPDIVITFNKEGGSKHPDHIQISYAATLAFNNYLKHVQKHVKLYHTVLPKKVLNQLQKEGIAPSAFGKVKGTPDHLVTTAIDISKTLAIKLKALEAHKTQHKDVERYIKRIKLPDSHHEFFRLIAENHIF